jgi:hypothetical protein
MPVIQMWNREKHASEEREISTLSNEELLDEYGAECEGYSRRISSDPPDMSQELYEEILKRMKQRSKY